MDRADNINISQLLQIMKESIEFYIITFVAGILVGMICGISIKYPVNLDNIHKYQMICGGEEITKVRVGITGDIYYVTCSNDIEIPVH